MSIFQRIKGGRERNLRERERSLKRRVYNLELCVIGFIAGANSVFGFCLKVKWLIGGAFTILYSMSQYEGTNIRANLGGEGGK